MKFTLYNSLIKIYLGYVLFILLKYIIHLIKRHLFKDWYSMHLYI